MTRSHRQVHKQLIARSLLAAHLSGVDPAESTGSMRAIRDDALH